MDPSDEVTQSLIKWLQTLVPIRTRNIMEISDGVAILEALIQISPVNFQNLECKIKTDVGNNWRLKVSNLRKIIEAIIEYYQDILNLQLLDIGRPDVNKLGESGDTIQLGKLLRLVLGCAVNCERKQEYITQIMALEECVQQCIMQAIQQLEELTGGPGRSTLSFVSLDTESRIVKLAAELEAANEAKDSLAQRCHNLETTVQSLLEEKQALQSDNQLLTAEIKEKRTPDNNRGIDNRRQLDLLKEEIFKLETVRDDYRAKVLDQDKQIAGLQEKIADFQVAAEATARLKDEVDALRESADKVKTLEIAVSSYKKKLEDHTDIKRQLKILEEKNVEYLQQNLKYEEELKKHNVWKNQTEMYKCQAVDLQQKLDEETQRLDKVSFQNRNLETKLEAVQAEKERILRERDSLREENEELRLNAHKGNDGAVMAQELAPTELKERLRFLEKENQALQISNQESNSKHLQLEDALERLEKLTEQNRSANQRIMELEAQLEDQKHREESSPLQDSSIKEYKQKISQLQEALMIKDQELQTSQAKYARSLEKAREVAMAMENIDSIRQNVMKEEEDRLMTTAFYRLGLQFQREAVDERLALLSAGQGQSFLSRQRQPTPRKPVTPFKSK